MCETHPSAAVLTLHPPDNQSLCLLYSLLGTRGEPSVKSLSQLPVCAEKNTSMDDEGKMGLEGCVVGNG